MAGGYFWREISRGGYPTRGRPSSTSYRHIIFYLLFDDIAKSIDEGEGTIILLKK